MISLSNFCFTSMQCIHTMKELGVLLNLKNNIIPKFCNKGFCNDVIIYPPKNNIQQWSILVRLISLAFLRALTYPHRSLLQVTRPSMC